MPPLSFTATEAAEIRRLLGARLAADRGEQKRLRRQLRELGFRISEYENGLTPAGFDALVSRGAITVGTAHSVVSRSVPSPAPPANPSAAAPSHQQQVAAPAGAWVHAAALGQLASPPWTLREARDLCPRRPGLYAVYGSTPVVCGLLGLGPAVDTRPLYVGKSEDDLAGRDVQSHFLGGTGSSTLRRTLAALLREELGLQAQPRNLAKPDHFDRYALDDGGELRLSAWMEEHLRLSVWVKPAIVGSLREIEEAVVRRWQPPLNLTHVSHSWSPQLKALRADMAREARAWQSKVGPTTW